MTARIVIEEPCEHGSAGECILGGWHYAPPDTYQLNCPGGSRRVLDPGELVDLIDNHTQAIIDGLRIKNLAVAPGASVAMDLGILDLDDLAVTPDA